MPAHTVNRFAGSHSISADPRELEAARRAGDTSLREFPYYRERFGDRSRLFAQSDGAWLAMLCGGGLVREEVLWLGRVLASRGIPRRLLERHLEILHGELAGALPDRARRYEPLSAAASSLAELRRARIPDADGRALSAAFRRAAGPEWVERLPEMGDILVAAAADEADGIEKAVESVERWAADPARFPDRWVSAVRGTIAAARERANLRGSR